MKTKNLEAMRDRMAGVGMFGPTHDALSELIELRKALRAERLKALAGGPTFDEAEVVARHAARIAAEDEEEP